MTAAPVTGPAIGDRVSVRGCACRIIAVRVFGTIDVETIAEPRRYFRVSGLAPVRGAR
jgi:hypothetical protein